MALNPDGMAYFFGMLFGKEVAVSPEKSTPLTKNSEVAICTYRDARGRQVAGCIFNYPLACFSSAALSMIPVGAAEDAIESKELPKSLQENLYEVFNVAVGFFGNGKIGPNLRLHEMYIFPGEPESKLEALCGRIGAKKDYSVKIEDYGQGDMSIFLLNN